MLMTWADGETSSSTAGLTNASCRTTSADCKRRTAFSVSSSGSPGPAPTRNTRAFAMSALHSVRRRCLRLVALGGEYRGAGEEGANFLHAVAGGEEGAGFSGGAPVAERSSQ